MIDLDSLYVESIVKMALAEDIGSGDVTTLLTIPKDARTSAVMIAKKEGIIAGLEVAHKAFKLIDSEVIFDAELHDGDHVEAGDEIARIWGKARALLTAERVALNFLQRMSGISTLTAKYVSLVKHTKAKIVDTRKTTPGLRRLEKYSVRVGGGYNHRFGLDDGILIKDNHIAAAGGIKEAIKSAKKQAPHTMKIEVEVTSIDQLREAIESGADAALLDNMSLDEMRKSVELAKGKILLEASGGVNEQNVAQIAETGVDIISVGALTHSPSALDISMNFTKDSG